jgi:hypothetical protein
MGGHVRPIVGLSLGCFVVVVVAACNLIGGFGDPLPGPDDAGSRSDGPPGVDGGSDSSDAGQGGGDGAAELVLANQGSIVAMVADGQSVFWVSDGMIYRADVGAEPVVIAHLAAADLAMDQQNLYVTLQDDGVVRRMAKDGGAGIVLANQPAAQGIAVDGTYVYYSAIAGGDVLRRIAKDGDGGGTPIDVVQPDAGKLSNVYRLAAGATNLYFQETGAINSVPKNAVNGDTTEVSNSNGGTSENTAIIENDGGVAWVTADPPGRVIVLTVRNGTQVVLIDGGVPEPCIAMDETYVYAKLQKVPRIGGVPTAFTGGLTDPQHIAVDARSVYVDVQDPMTPTARAIYRVRK